MHPGDVLCRAVEDVITPGAVAIVASGDEHGARLVLSVGRLSYFDGAKETSAETIYDLASLTKTISTTMLTAFAIDHDKLDLDETPWPLWPGVSVRHILHHQAGLPWWRPLYKDIPDLDRGTEAGRAQMLSSVWHSAVEHAPGEKTIYSDIGFIALGALLEERLGDRLDRLFRVVAAHTYGDTGLRYVPLFEEPHHPQLAEVAPTEHCSWRNRCLHGQVHDDNAYAMGGVAGHAGLFGSALDVERAARALLHGEGSLALFRACRSSDDRALGFDCASPDGTTGGALGSRAIGHLGFTGVSMWLDQDTPDARGAIYILLTNRVHPDRDNPSAIRQLRVDFHKAARAWLDDAIAR